VQGTDYLLAATVNLKVAFFRLVEA